jgi:hypothetical protein
MKTHTGGCHCGAVRFTVDANFKSAITCNCSHCHKKGVVLSFVPHEQFHLETGEDNLSTYNFNKKVIDHQFCKTCGVQAFGQNKERTTAAINLRCVDDIELKDVEITEYNGKDV